MNGISANGYALLGLTAIVAVLVGVLVYALMRFSNAARESRRHFSAGQTEHALLSAALADAIGRLKAQERATAARADASERLGSQIVDGLTSGLIVVGRDRRIETVNPAARRILRMEGHPSGGPSEESSSLEKPQLAPLLAVIDEALDADVPIARRTVQVETGSGVASLGVTVSPLRDASGDTHAVVCLFTDITQALALEEQLRLKEALARLGELTAGLAHELRNGLATVQGYAQLLDPQALAAPQRAYLDGIRAETHHLGDVVTRFLQFARPEPMVRTPVDVGAVVQRAVGELPGDVDVTVAGRFGVVDGDEVLLSRAFGNLIRNAVEACAGVGTRAQLEIRGEPEPDGRALRIIVADNGPGIPGDALPNVFRPFFTTRSGGTGLGLAIVLKVIVGHNGRVTAANRPEGGAAFRVTLPLSGESRI